MIWSACGVRRRSCSARHLQTILNPFSLFIPTVIVYICVSCVEVKWTAAVLWSAVIWWSSPSTSVPRTADMRSASPAMHALPPYVMLYPVYTIEQTSSRCNQNTRARRVLQLLDVCLTFARRLLDDCLMFVSCRLCFMCASFLFALCLLDCVNGILYRLIRYKLYTRFVFTSTQPFIPPG